MAIFIGSLTSTFPWNKMESLYYRVMLKRKDHSLKSKYGKFNDKMKLTKDALLEIKFTFFKSMRNPKIIITIYKDALLKDRGALINMKVQVEQGSLMSNN